MSEEKVELEGVDPTPTPSEVAGTPAPVTPTGLERAHPSIPALRDRFPDAFVRHQVVAGDEHVVFLSPERSYEILQWLKEDPAHDYALLADVTAVDYGGGRPLQVVYQLFSLAHRRALRVKVELPLDALEVESVVPLWAAADWLEREVWDMFGVRFRSHPDLRRILMPEGYGEGHPLRKDFPLRGRFSRAEQTRRALSQEVEDYYVPGEIGPGREPQLVRWQELSGVSKTASPNAPAPSQEDGT